MSQQLCHDKARHLLQGIISYVPSKDLPFCFYIKERNVLEWDVKQQINKQQMDNNSGDLILRSSPKVHKLSQL